jgi:hypothetical protein
LFGQPVGRVKEVLGEMDDAGMEIEIAVRKYSVPHQFSSACLALAADLPVKVRAKDLVDRIDLRDIALVTIDGEDARDFDDAVYCEPATFGKQKGWRLLVAIADVGHYVETGSAIDELKRLHEMGIELQIDDFGTGYSSLSKLQSLDIDVVKIDQSFVFKLATDHQSRALCETIVSIGRSLDIAIVAEGVETTEQLEILQAMNCDEVQGYLISRPVPPENIPALLTKKFF